MLMNTCLIDRSCSNFDKSHNNLQSYFPGLESNQESLLFWNALQPSFIPDDITLPEEENTTVPQNGTSPGKQNKERSKEGPRTGVRTSGRRNNTPAQPNLHRRPRREGKNVYKEEPKGWGVSPSCAHMRSLSLSLSSLYVFWVSMPPCLKDVFFFIF